MPTTLETRHTLTIVRMKALLANARVVDKQIREVCDDSPQHPGEVLNRLLRARDNITRRLNQLS